jgi:hypothetical protein
MKEPARMFNWNLFGVAAAGVLLALGAAPIESSAQPTERELRENIRDLTTLDPEIERYLPRWKILESDLKIKLAQYFSYTGVPVRESDSMIVTASFPDPETNAQDLLSLRVGESQAAVISGTDKLRNELGNRIYEEILRRDYQHVVIEPAVPVTESPRDRMPNVFYPATARQFVAISAFRQSVQLGRSGARLEHMLGNDEIGYHFWTSGQGRAWAHYPIIPLTDPALRARGVPDILTIDLGIAYRMKFGSAEDNFLGELISPRKLNGSIGPKAYTRIEYRLPQINDLGFAINAEVPFNKMISPQEVRADNSVVRAFEATGRLDPLPTAYFLRTVAQGNLFWENWLGGDDSYEHFFRVSLGVSYQEFARTTVGNVVEGEFIPLEDINALGDAVVYRDLIHPTEFEDWLYAKVDYLNQSGFPFGISGQLANRNLMLSGFIPVIKNWLFLEAKYSTPLLRDEPAPWEYKSFFMISPILRFELD